MKTDKLARGIAVLFFLIILIPSTIISSDLSKEEKDLLANAGIEEEAGLKLKKQLGFIPGSFHVLVGMDSEGNEVKSKGVAIYCSAAVAQKALKAMRKDLRNRGIMLFLSQQNFGTKPDELAMIKAKNQYEILRVMGTNGANYDIDTVALIKKLKEWEKLCEFEIDGASFDYMSAQITRMPANMQMFAEMVYKFCPDVVDQGTGDVKALKEEMEKTGTLYLWWD